MVVILGLILIICALVIGFAAGNAQGKRDRIPSKERAELEALRRQERTLQRHAAEHMALGDSTLAPIVLDEIEQTRRKSL